MKTDAVKHPGNNFSCTEVLIINGLVILLMLLFPLLCCLIDRFVYNFFIGPMVFFYLPITAIVMFPLVFLTAGVVLGPFMGFIAAVF